jgi:hypothetical protein
MRTRKAKDGQKQRQKQILRLQRRMTTKKHKQKQKQKRKQRQKHTSKGKNSIASNGKKHKHKQRRPGWVNVRHPTHREMLDVVGPGNLNGKGKDDGNGKSVMQGFFAALRMTSEERRE